MRCKHSKKKKKSWDKQARIPRSSFIQYVVISQSSLLQFIPHIPNIVFFQFYRKVLLLFFFCFLNASCKLVFVYQCATSFKRKQPWQQVRKYTDVNRTHLVPLGKINILQLSISIYYVRCKLTESKKVTRLVVRSLVHVITHCNAFVLDHFSPVVLFYSDFLNVYSCSIF